MKIFKYFLCELPPNYEEYFYICCMQCSSKSYLLSRPEPKIETSLGREWSCNEQVHDMHNFVNINKSITKITTSTVLHQLSQIFDMSNVQLIFVLKLIFFLLSCLFLILYNKLAFYTFV